MMKVAAAMLTVSGLALAQGPRVSPIGGGFGNVVFPGTGIPPINNSHASNLGATVRGVYPGGRGGPQPQGRPHNTVVVPVPVVVGGYGYGGYGYGYGAPQPDPQAQPNITVINAPQPAPSVIINQGYTPDRAQPAMYDYTGGNPGANNNSTGDLGFYQAPVPSNPEPPKPAPSASINDDVPTIYLIALKDGTVYPAYAYWLEADTLHYITTKHSHNKASLALVDEPLSLQLNRERRVEFKLKSQR